ncbi:MAG TPA: hypothetical protein VIU86_19840 [Gaiellaceae bacterium]
MSDLIVTARVRLTLDVVVSDTWTASVQLDQVEKEARESALQQLRAGVSHVVVGTPEVTAVLVRRWP